MSRYSHWSTSGDLWKYTLLFVVIAIAAVILLTRLTEQPGQQAPSTTESASSAPVDTLEIILNSLRVVETMPVHSRTIVSDFVGGPQYFNHIVLSFRFSALPYESVHIITTERNRRHYSINIAALYVEDGGTTHDLMVQDHLIPEQKRPGKRTLPALMVSEPQFLFVGGSGRLLVSIASYSLQGPFSTGWIGVRRMRPRLNR